MCAQTKDEAQKVAHQQWKQMDVESRRSLRKQREKLGVERTKLKLAWEAFERKYAKKVRRVLRWGGGHQRCVRGMALILPVRPRQERKLPVPDSMLGELPPMTLGPRPTFVARGCALGRQVHLGCGCDACPRSCGRRLANCGFGVGKREAGDLLMVWDFLRTFTNHGLLKVRAPDCGLALDFMDYVRSAKPAHLASDSSDAGSVAGDQALSLVLPRASASDVVAALQGNNWRANRFMTQLHTSLLRVLIGESLAPGPCLLLCSAGHSDGWVGDSQRTRRTRTRRPTRMRMTSC